MNTDALKRDLARAHLLNESLLRTDSNRPDVQATIARPPINPGSLSANPPRLFVFRQPNDVSGSMVNFKSDGIREYCEIHGLPYKDVPLSDEDAKDL